MPETVSVAVPGPWWTPLAYEADRPLSAGLRVRVPLGSSFRVGLVVDRPRPAEITNLKKIEKVIDASLTLPPDLWQTVLWFARTWFTGAGLAAKTLLPSKFFSEEPLAPAAAPKAASHYAVDYIYEPRDLVRYERYAALLAETGGAMALFPEAAQAKMFWTLLPPSLREGALLWPAAGAARQWDCWRRALAGEYSFIVGSQAAAYAPLRPSLLIIDDECSGAWRTQKYPIFHHRSLLAARAGFAGAKLVLGGRMPSSKAFMQQPAPSGAGAQERLVFVDLHNAAEFDVDAVRDPLKISRPLVRETLKARERNGWVFWLLDRKGYAGEIYCEDCGNSLHCRHCGGTLRWEAKSGSLVCLECGSRQPIPEKCPSCGGGFLEGIRPGLDALAEKAQIALRHRGGNVLYFQNEGAQVPSAKILKQEHPLGAVVVGTRKLLSLADVLAPSVIGWLDADFEARGADYDAHARAYAMLWESLWRGADPDRRIVVVQSRRPGKSWQSGLARGWDFFWRGELRSRQEWELPPHVPMLKILMPYGAESLAGSLAEQGLEYWESDETKGEIWVRTKRFALLARLLEPFFDIKNTRRGFPAVTLYLD